VHVLTHTHTDWDVSVFLTYLCCNPLCVVFVVAVLSEWEVRAEEAVEALVREWVCERECVCMS
jgi:hypothetical protein